MLSLPPAVQIYVAVEPADMRKSFNGLSILVHDVLRQDPLPGHLFVFRNRRGEGQDSILGSIRFLHLVHVA